MILRAVLICLCLFCMGQMPEWSFFKDGDGNSYYIDNAGKIVIPQTPDAEYKSLTVKGLDYYQVLADELIAAHKPADGLRIIKTILAMPADDARVIEASKKATASLQKLKHRQGSRLEEINRNAVPMMFIYDGKLRILQDIMRYSLAADAKYTIAVKQNNWRPRNRYLYHGLLLAVNTEADLQASKYDFVLAVDSEMFASKLWNIDQLENLWNGRMQWDGLNVRPVSQTRNKTIYSFKGEKLGGFQAFVMNGRFGYCLRAAAPIKKLPALQKAMLSLTESFTAVGEHQSK